MATSRGKSIKYGCSKHKTTSKLELVEFTPIFFTKLRGFAHFLPQPSNIFTQIYLPYLWHFATLPNLTLSHFVPSHFLAVTILTTIFCFYISIHPNIITIFCLSFVDNHIFVGHHLFVCLPRQCLLVSPLIPIHSFLEHFLHIFFVRTDNDTFLRPTKGPINHLACSCQWWWHWRIMTMVG